LRAHSAPPWTRCAETVSNWPQRFIPPWALIVSSANSFMARTPEKISVKKRGEVGPAQVAEWIPPLQLGLPVPSSDPFDEVSGVEFRRVFPNQVAPFEE